MNFDQLKTFYTVATMGSFTKAARSLFITQPAVSQQIRALEDSLGHSLFDRSNRKAFLTNDGEILLDYSRKLFDMYDEITSFFNSKAHMNQGKVSFASTRVIGTNFLSKTIVHFIKQYPGIELYFRLGNSHRVLDLILEGHVDFGIAGTTRNISGIVKTLIHQEELIAICSPHHHLTKKSCVSAEDLKNAPFIWREKGTQTRKVVTEWFLKNTGSELPPKSIVLEQIEAVKRIIAEGYGVAFIPKIAADKEIREGSLTRLFVQDFYHSVDSYLYHTKNKVFGNAAVTLLKIFAHSNMFSYSENLKEVVNRIVSPNIPTTSRPTKRETKT